ncbi:TlpA family protein disulfide reductase [Streptomyces sp. NPDC058614]|uniref:TlpA family protein disulfide reductase n=1 Tax=Streptomyces sp. NPDC058614 TaxID=3346557 RepID=UPI003668DB63
MASLLALTAGTLSACGTAESTANPGLPGAAKNSTSRYLAPADRTITPAVSGTTLTGKHLDIAQWRGNVVVINVWGSWCAPCRKEAPELARLAKETAASGVHFLGVDIRDSKRAALAFESDYGIGYPSLFDPDGRGLLGFKSLAARAVPTTYVLDRTGKVAAMSIGPLNARGFLPIIRGIAEEK